MMSTQRSETALGTWSHSDWEPEPDDALAGLVDRIWDFEGVLELPREQTFPDGTLSLVVQLDDPHRPVRDPSRPIGDAAVDPFPALCFDGMQTRSTTVEGPRGPCRVLGIVFRPLGASVLLGAGLRDLTDRSTDFEAIAGKAARELAGRIADASDGAERVRRALAWTAARMERSGETDPLVVRVFEHIERGHGNLAITQIDDLAGRSRSRLCAAFGDAVGLSPKRYARIVRFRRALKLVTAGTGSLGDVALRAGYYDQAHMNADFSDHAGLTPRAYLSALRYPGSTHLALY